MLGLILTGVQLEAATVGGEDDIGTSDDKVDRPPTTKLQTPVLGLGLLHKILQENILSVSRKYFMSPCF